LPVLWFFECLPDPSGGDDSDVDLSGEYSPKDRETYRLLGLFGAVEDRAKRKAILNILQSSIELIE